MNNTPNFKQRLLHFLNKKITTRYTWLDHGLLVLVSIIFIVFTIAFGKKLYLLSIHVSSVAVCALCWLVVVGFATALPVFLTDGVQRFWRLYDQPKGIFYRFLDWTMIFVGIFSLIALVIINELAWHNFFLAKNILLMYLTPVKLNELVFESYCAGLLLAFYLAGLNCFFISYLQIRLKNKTRTNNTTPKSFPRAGVNHDS